MKILTDILIISLFCNGVYLTTRQNMIFYFLHDWYLELSEGLLKSDGEIQWLSGGRRVLRFIYKPLFGCLPCMASIWGSVGYFCLGNSLNWQYPVIIIAVVCVNRIINQLYE